MGCLRLVNTEEFEPVLRVEHSKNRGTESPQLDARLGRWMSTDPIFQPHQSPYNSMDGNPVNLNDPSGLSTDKKVRREQRKREKKLSKAEEFVTTYENADEEFQSKRKNIRKYLKAQRVQNIYKRTVQVDPLFLEERPYIEKVEPKGQAIYVAFTDQTSTAGEGDNSTLAKLGEFFFGKNKKYPVDHAGVIIVSEDGVTKYFDFGRFGTRKYGRVRSSKTNRGSGNKGLVLADAELDEEGNITNLDEIMSSLLKNSSRYGSSYFDNAHGGKGYGTVKIAIYKDLDYKVMKKFAENHGVKVFGFGTNKSYCAKFAKDVVRAGGGSVNFGLTAGQVVYEIKTRFPEDNKDIKDYNSD